jgi:hypothetical protein
MNATVEAVQTAPQRTAIQASGRKLIFLAFSLTLIHLIFLLASAGTWKWANAWMYWVTVFTFQCVAVTLLARRNPDLLNQRGNAFRSDTKFFDRIILRLYLPLSLKLAKRLNRFAEEQHRILPALLEFNVGGEDTKSGWDAADDTQWNRLLPDVQNVLELTNLRVHGLMTMPPLGADPEDSRRFFQRLRLLRDHLAVHYPDVDWSELSMGTSADYTVAVEQGATLVRVGTAIVGARSYKSEKEAL